MKTYLITKNVPMCEDVQSIVKTSSKQQAVRLVNDKWKNRGCDLVCVLSDVKEIETNKVYLL
jgi:hypothetical protein